MASPTPPPKFTAFDSSGNPLSFGKLYTYLAGSLTPQATYTDSGAGTPNANPVELNARGEANVWLLPTALYKFILKDSNDVTIWTVDNVGGTVNISDLSNTSSATLGTALIGWLRSAAGAVATTLKKFLGWQDFALEEFLADGFVTDGSVDYATQIASALSASAGRKLRFPPNGTFKSSTGQVLPANTTLELNGSTLNFTPTGAVECLQLRNKTRVRNGTVKNTGSSPSGAGNYQAPIVIGDYGAGTGYSNIRIENVTLESNRDDGNLLVITGSSNDILVENVTLTGDATSGAGIIAHWGGADNPAAGTYHPSDITIRNIRAGTFSRSGAEIVYLAAAVNVTVENVHCDAVNKSVATAYAGDYGLYYASANIKALGFGGITIRNARCDSATSTCVTVDMQAPSAPGTPIYAVDGLLIEGCSSRGASLAGNAFSISNAYGVEIRGCKGTNHDTGVATGANVERLRIVGGEYWANNSDGISLTHATPPKDCTVQGVYSHGNGLGGGNKAGILANTGSGHIIQENIVGETGEATQIFGVRVGTAVTNAVVVDNHCRGCKNAGIAYSIGGATSWVTKKYSGNTSVAIGGGGQIFDGPNPVIIDTFNRGNTDPNTTNYLLFGSSAPAAGTWVAGDRALLSTLAGSDYTSCLTGGTPGTWAKNRKRGTFTMDAAATKTIADVDVTATSIITLMTANAAARTLQGGANMLCISGRTAATSFDVATSGGGSAVGTENFEYEILN